MNNVKSICAGILPFFQKSFQNNSNGTQVFSNYDILLAKEYRKRYDIPGSNPYFYMSFGGNSEENESLAETALREFLEETGYAFKDEITLEDVLKAEKLEEYIDYFNEKTGIFYRMYCIKLKNKIDIEDIKKSAILNPDHLEKIEWKYFSARDIIFSEDGTLPNEECKIYPTEFIRFSLLREKYSVKEFV